MKVFDAHIHVQPWEMLLPAVRARMEAGRKDLDAIRELMASPRALLSFLDRAGIERVALINYPSPDLMGFTAEVNAWCARYCAEAPERTERDCCGTPVLVGVPLSAVRRGDGE